MLAYVMLADDDSDSKRDGDDIDNDVRDDTENYDNESEERGKG